MEKRRAYLLLWRASRHLSDHHHPLSHRGFHSGSEFNCGKKLHQLSTFGQKRHPFHISRLCAVVQQSVCFQRSIGLQCRAYGSTASLIQRSPSFSEINSDDISYFKSILGENNVIQDSDRLEPANTDWMHKYKGSSKLLLLPRSTEEVSHIMKYCNSRCLAVVPQGGNTGLVGGSVPVFDEVIVNMNSMNKIISFDKVSGILVCEAGCILENLESFLDNEG